MEQDTYPYDMPDDGDVLDDLGFASEIDTKAGITRYRPSSPNDSIPDPSSFIDGSTRIHEDGYRSRIFTTGPGRHIGSTKGWVSSPDPLPGDDDPTFTLQDLFDDEERYMKRVQRDVRVIEALRPRDIPRVIRKRK